MHAWIVNVCWKCWTMTANRENNLIQWAHGVSKKKRLLDIRQKWGRNSALAQNANDLVRGPCAPPSPLLSVCPLYSTEYRSSVKSILGGAIVLWEATVKLNCLGPGPGRGSSFYSRGLWESCTVRLKNTQPEVCVWNEWPTFHSSFLVYVSGTAAIITRPYAV